MPRCGRRYRVGGRRDGRLHECGDARFAAHIAHDFDDSQRLERGVVLRIETQVACPNPDSLRARCSAVGRPIPLEPPVMMAVVMGVGRWALEESSSARIVL